MSDFKFQGRIIAIGEIKRGTSASGNWAVQEYTIQEESENYPMKMTFEVFGEDKITSFAIKEDERLTVHFRMDSKEYNGRRFNSIRAWKIERDAIGEETPKMQIPTNEPPF